MKRIIPVLAFLLISATASAQSQWSLGVDYMALRTNLAVPEDPERAPLNAVMGNGGGISLQWQPGQRVMLETGAFIGSVRSTWTTPDVSHSTLEMQIPMMQVPLLLHVRLFGTERAAFHATLGAALTRAANGQLINRTTGELGLFETNQTGMAGVAGAEISYGSRLPLRLAVRYTHGLSSVLPAEDTKVRNVNVLLGVRVLRW